jgi:hypothetical protein
MMPGVVEDVHVKAWANRVEEVDEILLLWVGGGLRRRTEIAKSN